MGWKPDLSEGSTNQNAPRGNTIITSSHKEMFISDKDLINSMNSTCLSCPPPKKRHLFPNKIVPFILLFHKFKTATKGKFLPSKKIYSSLLKIYLTYLSRPDF